MPTVKASLIVPHREEAERIADLLQAAFDPSENPVALFDDEDAGHWTVDLYEDGTDTAGLERRVREALGSDAFAAPLHVEILGDVDWVTASLEGLDAIRAGRFVVHGLHARDRVRPTDIGIRVEASRAFGTGHHGTTLGCLELIGWLHGRVAPRRVLDLGTGTGILAMAAAHTFKRSGAGPYIMASDVDPVSVEVTAENLKLNGLAHAVRPVLADGLNGTVRRFGPYDLVIANILAGPLIVLAAEIVAATQPGGRIILSGLMRHQERAVLARYRALGLYPERRIHHGEWSALLLKGAR